MFTFKEYAGMHLIYGEMHQNALVAAKMYAELHLNRLLPHSSVFANVDRRLRENGQFGATKRVGQRTIQILDLVDDVSTISIGATSRILGTSICTVWRVLRKECLHPYLSLKMVWITFL
jgi:hypothetical protein